MIARIIAFMMVVTTILFSEGYALDLEITPTYGYTFGGSFEDSVTETELTIEEGQSYGLIIDFNISDDSQIEIFYSRQSTEIKADSGTFTGDPLFDIDINYLHLGGTYSETYRSMHPYVAAGVGLTHMTPDRGDAETKFSLSLAGGGKWFFSEHIGIRFEGRGFGTYMSGSNKVFCRDNDCAVITKGDLFWQFMFFSGLSVKL